VTAELHGIREDAGRPKSCWRAVRADADPDDFTIATVPDFLAGREDPWADIDANAQSIEPLLEMVKADEDKGLGDMPYPPSYPKMPGEPPRVQPSKKVAANWDEDGNPVKDGQEH